MSDVTKLDLAEEFSGQTWLWALIRHDTSVDLVPGSIRELISQKLTDAQLRDINAKIIGLLNIEPARQELDELGDRYPAVALVILYLATLHELLARSAASHIACQYGCKR